MRAIIDKTGGRSVLYYGKNTDGEYEWETGATVPMEGDTICIGRAVYQVGLDQGDGSGATLTYLGSADECTADFDADDIGLKQ